MNAGQPIPLGLHLLWELDETLAGTLDALARYGRARRSSIAVRRMYSSEVLRQVKAEAEKLAEILAEYVEETSPDMEVEHARTEVVAVGTAEGAGDA